MAKKCPGRIRIIMLWPAGSVRNITDPEQFWIQSPKFTDSEPDIPERCVLKVDGSEKLGGTGRR
jgi:hypothetical protein